MTAVTAASWASASAFGEARAERVERLSTRIISQQPDLYHGWPTLTRLRDGDLVVVWSGGREAHVCPFGRVEMMRSRDDGRTWTVPHEIGVWGLPSHLLRLRDGRLLMSYGHRRPPFGNQARLSEDGGRRWSEPLAVSADGASGDLGYPSTAQLADGSLLTVWYELPAESDRAVLRLCHWRIRDS